jgi:hypothetical protein
LKIFFILCKEKYSKRRKFNKKPNKYNKNTGLKVWFSGRALA